MAHMQPSAEYKDYCRRTKEGNMSNPVEWTIYHSNGEWWWKRQARNGEIIAASTEGYHNLKDCKANAEVSGYVEAVSVTTSEAATSEASEFILARGETRIGDEHTEADDAEWTSESDGGSAG